MPRDDVRGANLFALRLLPWPLRLNEFSRAAINNLPPSIHHLVEILPWSEKLNHCIMAV